MSHLTKLKIGGEKMKFGEAIEKAKTGMAEKVNAYKFAVYLQRLTIVVRKRGATNTPGYRRNSEENSHARCKSLLTVSESFNGFSP